MPKSLIFRCLCFLHRKRKGLDLPAEEPSALHLGAHEKEAEIRGFRTGRVLRVQPLIFQRRKLRPLSHISVGSALTQVSESCGGRIGPILQKLRPQKGPSGLVSGSCYRADELKSLAALIPRSKREPRWETSLYQCVV